MQGRQDGKKKERIEGVGGGPPAAPCKYRTHNATMDWRTRNGKWLSHVRRWPTNLVLGCVSTVLVHATFDHV